MRVVSDLASDAARGLAVPEAERRLASHGDNELTHAATRPAWSIAVSQFNQPLVLILLGAVVITAAIGEYVDSLVIALVVLVNATIGYIQESKALQAMEALAKSLAGAATVIRDGERHVVAAAQVVPGDLVVLQAGDRVPADLRLLSTRQLHIEESALTGESVPASKNTDLLAADTMLADRANLALSSTLVTAGQATGVVVGTGDATEIGRVNKMVAQAEILATPLTRRINRFSKVLLWIILMLAAVTFAIGILRGESWLDMFLAAVALAVGAIPEGLPAAMTITLAIGMHRMARRNAIIRRLPAVETLGSTTVICSDKTGTLTQNAMTVQQIIAGDVHYEVSGSGYTPTGVVLANSRTVEQPLPWPLAETLRAGVLCNDAHLFEEQGQWQVNGDPTEGGLIVAAAKAGIELVDIEASYRRLDVVPFASEYQLMATLHETDHGNTVYVKGSVERVLACCQEVAMAQESRYPLDVAAVHAQAEELARNGLRVLAFAVGQLPADQVELTHGDISSGMTFLGLQAMLDPPREQTPASVAACQDAGITVKMITGDHRVTATAIAEQIGLAAGIEQNVGSVSGTELERVDDEALAELADSGAVFARVSPEQKLRLVHSLQARGHVVAMTGDGVNDAPAVKQADIGVAMGLSGTEVAKESADMVLTDDDFSTIAAAVEEGRGVFDNLTKFITWTLPTNIGEGLVIFTAILAGVTLPVTPVQILWINMTTAILLGLTLAFERKEPNIMTRPPRSPTAPILSRELVVRVVLVGLLLLATAYGLFQAELAAGASLEQARTVAVNMFVFGELFYLFNCRSLHLPMWRIGITSNPLLLAGVAAMILLQIGYTYSPPMQALFASAPLSAQQWGQILIAGLSIYVIVGIQKWWVHRSARRMTNQHSPALTQR
ncbi:MAG: cation-transporting P-type ATPase [Actinomycetia bacterium]|nr:cation-transporting P-type ATPase [Actinomycetes bacterium]